MEGGSPNAAIATRRPERDTATVVSHPNVDLVRRGAEAINAREVPQGLITPDVRMENVSTAVTEKTYLGAIGVRDWDERLLRRLR